MTLHLAPEPAENELLERNPFALLVAMVLDQQIPLERAFAAPLELAGRLGAEPDPALVAGYHPDALAALFATPPALHRFPSAMAARVGELARLLVADYGGDAARVWTEADSGPALLRRLQALPGFGPAKAKIFVALLGKQFGVRPDGWRESAGDYGADGVYRSVADITDADSLGRVRSYKQQIKAQAKAAAGRRAR